MIKKSQFVLLTLALSFSLSGFAGAKSAVVQIDGKTISQNYGQAEVKNGKTYFTIRSVLEGLGAKVTYDQASKKVSANVKGKQLTFKIGEFSSYLKNNRTFVDANFIINKLGYKTSDKNGVVSISTKPAVTVAKNATPPKNSTPSKPAPKPVAKPTTTATVVDASSIFAKSCAGCHGADLSGGYAPDLSHIGSQLSKDQIKQIISNGKGGMPAGIASGKDAEALAQWLSSKK